ncbi:MAG: hypothetical protein MSH33_04880 [Fusobacterium necrophorum]|nr:hypothetical protein [Fusobacterium necrophorum]
MAETQSTNLKLDLVDGDSLFDTGKVKSNFEKIDTAVGSLTEKKMYTISDVIAINGATIKVFNAIKIGNFAIVSLRISITKNNVECLSLPFSSALGVAYPISFSAAWDITGKTGWFQISSNKLFATTSIELNTDYLAHFAIAVK